MKISVVIPAYNSARFLPMTLDSVIRQTLQPDEILVADDGSTDNTVAMLESYQPRITVFQRKNGGVAAARNFLSQQASGDLIAFLDHDDIWHRHYLEVQHRLHENYPKAVASFTDHIDFNGYGNYEWPADEPFQLPPAKRFDPLEFLKRYNISSSTFYTMSVCCVQKKTLRELGPQPFSEKVSGVDDCYFCNSMPLLGPVVYAANSLVAYRVTAQAQSAHHLRNFSMVVDAFKDLEKKYQNQPDAALYRMFRWCFAGKRRRYGKTLMDAGSIPAARAEFKSAFAASANPVSMTKSLGLFFLTYLPHALQPEWPSSYRKSTA
ncbi:MAG TPA: glycosyltransferase family 2 protein [Verrucomicrobiae bacterium]|nr:glycosyltransferase family 2 protein [Verrucomicrobiae bacterium]